MTLTLYPPLCFNQPGQRDNNEDSVSPSAGTATADNRVFVVCDGVGGGASGEIASRIVADVKALREVFASEETIAAALQSAEQLVQTYLQTHPDAAGMATTLTLLHLHDQGATIAHVGDSRVYCCREGRAVFETDDHKLVNEWVQNGILTPEQAADHPQRNVITRAVRGTDKPVRADVALLKGLRADDYFFLCTDGVLENLTTEQLCSILATDASDEAKLTAIRACCDGKTSDNYSAYLVHVNTIDTTGDLPMDEAPATPLSQPVSTIPVTPASVLAAPVTAKALTTVAGAPVVSAQTRPAAVLPTVQPLRPTTSGLTPRMEPPFRYLLLGLLLTLGLAFFWFKVRSSVTSHGLPKPPLSVPPRHHPTLPRIGGRR